MEEIYVDRIADYPGSGIYAEKGIQDRNTERWLIVECWGQIWINTLGRGTHPNPCDAGDLHLPGQRIRMHMSGLGDSTLDQPQREFGTASRSQLRIFG